MHIVYKDKDIKKTCNDINEAKKRYPAKIARKLIKAINFIKSADSLQDVIQYPPFHFHDLKGKGKVNMLLILMVGEVVIDLS